MDCRKVSIHCIAWGVLDGGTTRSARYIGNALLRQIVINIG